jgi:hypothetical protein
MEALGAIVEQLLIQLEKSNMLRPADTDGLLKGALDDLQANMHVRDATRARASEYVEHLRLVIVAQRSDR